MTARSWQLPPSEFWGMTFSEWYTEAMYYMEKTPEGRSLSRLPEWERLHELSDEEWWAENG